MAVMLFRRRGHFSRVSLTVASEPEEQVSGSELITPPVSGTRRLARRLPGKPSVFSKYQPTLNELGYALVPLFVFAGAEESETKNKTQVSVEQSQPPAGVEVALARFV